MLRVDGIRFLTVCTAASTSVLGEALLSRKARSAVQCLCNEPARDGWMNGRIPIACINSQTNVLLLSAPPHSLFPYSFLFSFFSLFLFLLLFLFFFLLLLFFISLFLFLFIFLFLFYLYLFAPAFDLPCLLVKPFYVISLIVIFTTITIISIHIFAFI